MRRMFGFALLFISSSIPLMAAKNSQTFYLSSDVRAGNVELPRGICEVTWSTPSGSRVQLTVKTDDKKTVTVPALMVEGKDDRADKPSYERQQHHGYHKGEAGRRGV